MKNRSVLLGQKCPIRNVPTGQKIERSELK